MFFKKKLAPEQFDAPVASAGTPSGDLAAFAGLANGFQQAFYLVGIIQAAENTYNTGLVDPADAVNAVTAAFDYDGKRGVLSAILPITGNNLAELVDLPY
jgi:hypothetical protein